MQRAHWTCCGSASIIIVYMYKRVARSFSEGEGVLLAFAWSGADGTADGEVAPARKDKKPDDQTTQHIHRGARQTKQQARLVLSDAIGAQCAIL